MVRFSSQNVLILYMYNNDYIYEILNNVYCSGCHILKGSENVKFWRTRCSSYDNKQEEWTNECLKGITQILITLYIKYSDRTETRSTSIIHNELYIYMLRAVSEWGQSGDDSHLGQTIVRIPKTPAQLGMG